MKKSLVLGTVASAVAAIGMTLASPAPQAKAMWCPDAVASGNFHMWVIFSTIVVEWCDWAPPVWGVDSHRHCEYGGYIGYGGRCDWRDSGNIIVPPPPGFV